jgi:predicted RNase H-like HicB family nuclease
MNITHFPIIIHKDTDSSFGVIVPDLSGCFSAGNSLEDALRNLQEAVEVHLHGETARPAPSALEKWRKSPDAKGAYAVKLAPVDMSFIDDKVVRINITARYSQLVAVDRAAHEARMDRSAYLVESALARAAQEKALMKETKAVSPTKPRRA